MPLQVQSVTNKVKGESGTKQRVSKLPGSNEHLSDKEGKYLAN